LLGNYTIEQKLRSELDINSRKLNLKKIAHHFLLMSPDYDLDHLLSSDVTYTLSELVQHCEPFTSE